MIVQQLRGLEKALARVPPLRMLKALPETGGFAIRTLVRQRTSRLPDGLPDTRLTPSLLAHVALDEAILTAAMGPDRFPRRADYERVGAELAAARELFDRRGWLGDPRSYHSDPPPLTHVQVGGGWAHRLRYERLVWESGFEPRAEEPGADRWLGYQSNRLAGAWMLRHPGDEPRPWLVCLHGFGMGYAFMDFPAFHAAHLHRDLGLNLIGPTLPLHGRRKVARMSGDQFLGFDLVNTVHGLAQAVWDVRRVLGWLREVQAAPAIGLYGVSLGAYTAALVAGFEPDLALVLAGIPVSDFPSMFRSQSPLPIARRAVEHGILGGPAEDVHRVVSPLTIEPAVPLERRFIFAGLADRMSHPRQAHALWQHWGRPRIRWYPGNHVGYLWSSTVTAFVDEVLVGSDLARPGDSVQRERVPADG
ncbi:alpha/beta hydrolase family protein [Rhabdothermincola sediminis]|uniref:alpha/beta hydrolase family protein n=1 Tax=Rhabdothermincola sediminis TaxID=2751370 RepID=UPI001AA0A760|nr:alpha/beta hydrolase [Rhabdothermincola sediminis]